MDATCNIVIADDRASDVAMIGTQLEKAGVSFQCRRVETLKDFQLEIKAFTPDLVLAEYEFPGFRVVDALDYLKKQQINCPVLLVSRNHSEEVVVECIREGALDFISKESLIRLPAAVKNTLAKTKAEREMAATEAQYRLITEGSRDLICLLDRKFEILYASPSFKRVLNHDPAALMSIPFMSLVHPDDLKMLEKFLEEALFFREGRNVEIRICNATGIWQGFEAIVSFIFDENGSPVRALIVSRDTSDRKSAEKEIRKLAAFPRFNPNPVLEFAADGSLTYFNDAAMNMARRLKRPHPQMILPLTTANLVKRCLSTRKSQLHIESMVAGRCLNWSFFPIVGNHVVHCYAEDVTDSRNLEAQLRQAQKMDSIGQLASGVAHDFNNILTVIQGHSSLLLSMVELDPLVSKSMEQISQAAEKAANLTRQLLMFSRKQVMQRQLLNLNDVIGNVDKMLHSMAGESIKFQRNLMPDLPPIHADPGMMEQVLVNLVVNARDAMENGGSILLETSFIETDESYVQRYPMAREGRFVELAVKDTGHGMDETTLGHIFEPFFTTKEIGQGTGLGLATLYGIVKQHEGWVLVDSQPDQGTSFRIYIPVSSKALPSNLSGEKTVVPGGHETILVVEDEDSLRELVQEILEKKGYRVLPAHNGVAALSVWNEHKEEIDLLLTDMMMPEGVSGKELALEVLTQKEDLKVIYTSGYSIDVVNPGFVSEAGHTFLQKPYHPETLAQAVRDCLQDAVDG